MTQDDKQLLLKDLCMRLPYGVKVKCNDDTEPYTLLSINWNKEIVSIGFEIDGMYVTSKQKLADIKPYLRPMSSMTEDEKKRYDDILTKMYYHEKSTLGDISDYLNSIHVDYRGLIEKNLALDCTGLHIYD